MHKIDVLDPVAHYRDQAALYRLPPVGGRAGFDGVPVRERLAQQFEARADAIEAALIRRNALAATVDRIAARVERSMLPIEPRSRADRLSSTADILIQMDRLIDRLDALGLGIAAAHLSMAAETIRAGISSAEKLSSSASSRLRPDVDS
jgi:hypothetical protein